jgi:hypothetical protein
MKIIYICSASLCTLFLSGCEEFFGLDYDSTVCTHGGKNIKCEHISDMDCLVLDRVRYCSPKPTNLTEEKKCYFEDKEVDCQKDMICSIIVKGENYWTYCPKTCAQTVNNITISGLPCD